MPPLRDPFANFERMRRQMDELFGDVLGRTGLPARAARFSPPIDVYYCGEPPKAVLTAELAGVDPASLDLEIRGREVVLSGNRAPAEAQGRVYQQLEIERGSFRRMVTLGADVRSDAARAVFENGLLRVELPLAQPAGATRTVPIELPEEPTE